jgi:prolyl oligopeptidase
MTIAPPPTRREAVIETLHSTPVADPYRWLEAGESHEVRAWTDAQNARTEATLRAVPGRAAIESRLSELLQVGTVSAPAVHGDRYFYLKRVGTQNQPVLCARDGAGGDERVVVDPNTLDETGLVALDWWYPSPDGRLVAFGTSRDGDEWSTLRVVEVDSGRLLADEIARTRYCSLAWCPDNRGFFYTRYPTPGTVPPGQEEYNDHAYFHRLGNDPAVDPKVFGEGRSPQDIIYLATSRDGRWLVATAFQGWVRSEVYLCDLTREDRPWTPLIEGHDALFEDAIPTADWLYLLTNADAPNFRIIAIDLTDPTGPEEGWRSVIAARPDRVIQGFVLAQDRIVTHELEAATSRLRVYERDGAPSGELHLPGLGSVGGLAAEETGSTVVASF